MFFLVKKSENFWFCLCMFVKKKWVIFYGFMFRWCVSVILLFIRGFDVWKVVILVGE